MRCVACGLLLLAALVAPAVAQAPDEAEGVPPGKARLLFLTEVPWPWPSLEEARSSARCDGTPLAKAIADIKAADPEKDAGEQIAAGDFSLKSAQSRYGSHGVCGWIVPKPAESTTQGAREAK